MAEVRPFRALRYSPDIDLSSAVSPPFDVISPEEQRALHDRSPHNAVRIELAIPENGDPYSTAASTLKKWLSEGALRRDDSPAYYLYRQTFKHSGRAYTRTMIFARVRLEPWSAGVVLPHEQTFGAPKEDRLKLLRALNVQASPIFLIYRDREGAMAPALELAASSPPDAAFDTEDGQSHALHLIRDPETAATLQKGFADETLYIADGHHRYETLLGFRDEQRAKTGSWTGEESTNFGMAAISAARDPGMLVLPIHRLTAAGSRWEEARDRLEPLFEIEQFPSIDELTAAMESRPQAFGLLAREAAAPLLLTVRDKAAVDIHLPQDRSVAWRSLDYSIANHAIMRYGLELRSDQMTDYSTVWFSEDAAEAERAVQEGEARYAVILKPISVESVLDLAEEGERMPQKSTFFYPKVPTGLLYNPLDD